MKVILSGGGTAGHVNPAIAIADFIKGRHSGADIRFFGTDYGIEQVLVPAAGYPLKLIDVNGLERKLTLRNLQNAAKAVGAYRESRRFLKDFEPDLVIGTGGYVSGPVVLAASKLGIPTAIHEQNAFPGLTTRQLARRVDLVLLGFADAQPRLRGKHFVTVGNPVRQDMLFATRETARARLGIPAEERLVVSFAGSMGSRRFNENILDYMAAHSAQRAFRHIHAAGQFGIKWMPQDLAARGVSLEQCPWIDLREYIFDMQDVMAAADLVICRSGAITLGELAVLGKPAILIPSPNVTNNHQYYNALVFSRAEAALLVEEATCNGQQLLAQTMELLSDPDRLKQMGQAAGRLAVFDSTQRIYDSLMPLLRGH
ncbi:MAG: undecaprenyldiphospho-muramoylpentapeptide beta-N-acetylglucosaminyltransferase [Clostridiales bacterium]|nr:undecaprenyldiphospho-muramoylpentapeptide beta-N-acetylglucosaminyltransferase [Clostridiales bacterium]